jgi:5-methylcytosine-specific restriction protein A
MARTVDEWIGKTDDTRPPPRVRVRVFERYEGRCYLSGRKIMGGEKWELEHVKALTNGGENRESNLAPALVAPHREKTKDDLAEKSKVYRMKAKHLGQWPKGQRIMSRGFEKRRVPS